MPLYQCAGGAIFEITPPAPGSNARELFDAQLAAGALVPVDEPKPARKRAPKLEESS
jgi:hypothetical protein